MLRQLPPAALLTVCALATWPGDATSAPTVRADIEYAKSGGGEPLRLDLYTPESGAAAPLLVWLHG